MFCRPRESFWQSTKNYVGIDNDEERNTDALARPVMNMYEIQESEWILYCQTSFMLK